MSFLGIISISIFLILNQVVFGANEITREKAKKIISNQYPQNYHGLIPTFVTLMDNIIANKLIKEGLIKLNSSFVILSEKGKQYFIKKDIEPENHFNVYVVKAGIINFGEITGIAQLMPNIAKVEYTVIFSDLTPFGAILGASAGSINKSATLMLYDDGWRLTEESQ